MLEPYLVSIKPRKIIKIDYFHIALDIILFLNQTKMPLIVAYKYIKKTQKKTTKQTHAYTHIFFLCNINTI